MTIFLRIINWLPFAQILDKIETKASEAVTNAAGSASIAPEPLLHQVTGQQ
jgi:hypothetical protein